MIKGKGCYREAPVFVDDFMGSGVNDVENDLKTEVMAKKSQLCIQHRLKLGRCIDMQRSGSPEKAEGADHAYKAETVVAMQMGYEDGGEAGKTDV